MGLKVKYRIQKKAAKFIENLIPWSLRIEQFSQFERRQVTILMLQLRIELDRFPVLHADCEIKNFGEDWRYPVENMQREDEKCYRLLGFWRNKNGMRLRESNKQIQETAFCRSLSILSFQNFDESDSNLKWEIVVFFNGNYWSAKSISKTWRTFCCFDRMAAASLCLFSISTCRPLFRHLVNIPILALLFLLFLLYILIFSSTSLIVSRYLIINYCDNFFKYNKRVKLL